MNKILENKNMIHIAAEVTVLVGLVFYFNQKNKKMLGHIEDLSQRIEEHEDLLQKHEQVIRELVNQLNRPLHHNYQPTQHAKRKPHRRRKTTTIVDLQPQEVTEEKTRTDKPKISFATPEAIIEEYSSEEDLDAELKEEIGELVDIQQE